ncbi:NAD-dependent protein deacylase [Salinibacter sp. 10B]|uniref:SIR2 family NAD-dependent protein deacylase n=1 Tax=Salinibacter sp. 10B TaxID=1923971 RepID=UPI000CF37D45|nr:NAD-dependent deacylase [Salinibacter sp. 10B]PQJ34930.1 NAD-dependent protein deacylase [Salinibacter sp. 10B]
MSAFSNTLIDRLAAAEHVAVLTGAGISAESGIPTFRDPDGLWEKFDPQELANVEAFLDNPELVQGWYQHRRQLVEEAEPNAGHRALADLEAHVEEISIITQNVDDLHNRAGSRTVIELHGNITHNYCMDCERPAEAETVDAAIQNGTPARCPECDGLIRPDVVWFGEMLPPNAIEQADAATTQADVFLSVGTSAVVYPAAQFPMEARANGAYVAEINPDTTGITDEINESIRGPAGDILPALRDAVAERKGQ